MTIVKIFFWVCVNASLLLTVLLFLGQRSLAPLSNPGARANESAVIFLMMMLLRWLLLAVAACLLATALWMGGRIGPMQAAALTAGMLLIHLALGWAIAMIWNYWVSVIFEKTRARLWLSVVGYFGIPLAIIGALGAGALVSL